MSTQNRQWVDLDECINFYLDESEQGVHKYFKCFNLAFRALDELGLDFFYSVKSVKLPINSNLTVTLPGDYLNYSKVGVLNDKGEVVTLNYNNKLTTYADLLPDRIAKTQDNSLSNIYNPQSGVFYNYYDNGTFGNLYGLPSGAPFVGSFKIDNANGVILLNETFKYEYLILEYISSPKEGEAYFLPIHFREAIIAYLRWKDIISLPNSRRGTLGDKRDRRHDYYNERRLAVLRYKPLSVQDGYQSSLESTRLTVKT
jgi:hypothetical protein